MSDEKVKVKSTAGIEVYKDAANQWRWRLKAKNGRVIVASSEGFKTRAALQKNVFSVAEFFLAGGMDAFYYAVDKYLKANNLRSRS